MIPTYRKGDSGDGVKALQTALNAAGAKLEADGDFGAKTDKAVRAYQKNKGLTVDGIAGADTQIALDMLAAATTTVDDTSSPWTSDGWLKTARQCPAHPGRMGGTIDAKSIVAHTTDCYRGSMPGILRRWHESIDNGACAHFCIGKRAATPADLAEAWPSCGLVQMVPITRNGNHAGGAHMLNGVLQQWHGNYNINGAVTHPNLVTVGIEVDNAGRLYKAHGVWTHADSQCVVPDADVFVDDEGRGWEKLTDWQLQALGDLIEQLDERLSHFPAGVKVLPNGDHVKNGVRWAAQTETRVVGHATLDPNNKTDPGPQVMSYLRKRFDFS